jgi:membrane protease YdiL (CAAX protease family)
VSSINSDPEPTPVSGPILSDRALAGWEILSVVSSIMIAEWMLAYVAGVMKLIVFIPVGLALAVMISSHRLRSETLRDLGFRMDNFLRASKILLGPMIVAAGLAVLAGFLLKTRPDLLRWHAGRPIVAQMGISTGWGLLQHYVLQGFINRRLQLIQGPGAASILLTAVVFSALHFPNPWLMVVTFAGGAVWAFAYQRAPNLFALAISHSVITWVLVSTLPPSVLNHLRIGLRYFF